MVLELPSTLMNSRGADVETVLVRCHVSNC